MAARFQIDWLSNPEFKDWIQEVPKDIHQARCCLCHTSFSLSNMGRRAVASHAKGTQHKRRVLAAKQSSAITCFIKPLVSQISPAESSEVKNIYDPNGTSTAAKNPELDINTRSDVNDAPQPVFPTPRGLKSFLLNEDVTKAEILWSLHTIVSHKSIRMSEKDVILFKTLFTDSEIAQKMQLQRSKIAYSILYGIAPFFKDNLQEKVNKCVYFSVGFDESLNKIAQRTQMDVNVRFWCSDKNQICTRYFSSAFLGRSTADDIRNSFKTTLAPLRLSAVIQVSMDGPNVNHKFYRDLKAELSLDNNPVMLDIGSCGLHVLHGAFKTGIKATKWPLFNFLRSLYNLFKDVPARRALYTEYSGSNIFPQKFCSVRWLQNGDIVQRAIDILPNVKKFVDVLKKEKKEYACASFKTVSFVIKDTLLEAKLAFFKSLTDEVEPFLKKYQSDVPLVPFLHGSLMLILKNVMSRFVKGDLLKETISIHRLDVSDKKNLLPINEIDLGYGTRSALRKRNKDKVSDSDIFQFRKECQLSLKDFTLKLLERSPLIYPLTRAVACFDPAVAANAVIRKKRIKSLLTILEANRWISATTANKADRDFEKVCSETIVIEQFKEYKKKDSRVDVFWRDLFSQFGNPESILLVMKLVMSLSHGNANVERGFSVNSECLVENLKEETLIAQRVVYDAIVTTVQDVNKFVIPKSLIHSFRNSRSRLTEETKKRKKDMMENETKEAQQKRMKMATKELENKIAKIKENANKEINDIQEEIKSLRD